MFLDELENEAQAERWREVLNHVVVEHAWTARLHDTLGYLELALDRADATTWGINWLLMVAPDGRIAEDDGVHVSSFYDTFADLLTAAAARTATS